MAEETLTEALANLNDDNIKSAAVPEHKRPDIEDPQEESTFIDLSDDDVAEVSPVTEDQVQENFEDGSLGQDDADLSEVEKEAKKAQNRVNQAIKQAKDYQRRELQALQYAKQLQEDNKRLSSQIQLESQQTAQNNLELSKNYSNEFESRVDAQVDAAKVALKTAYDSGDQNLMVDAQQQLARAEAERNQLSQYQRELAKYEQDLEQWQSAQTNIQQEFPDYNPQQNYQPQTQAQPQPQYSQPSQKATSWAEKNEWFGVDRIMTNAAMAIHQELAETGIDLESDEYYSQLDNRLREELPNKFQTSNNVGNSGKPVQTVVSGTRTTGTGRSQNDRRVELTPSEQALAKKLGVPFKEYAKQKLRLQAS
tara:strand:- start:2498 stop:3595 length:1098 start_codon:yes stop_codon:yes gene_type:complete